MKELRGFNYVDLYIIMRFYKKEFGDFEVDFFASYSL